MNNLRTLLITVVLSAVLGMAGFAAALSPPAVKTQHDCDDKKDNGNDKDKDCSPTSCTIPSVEAADKITEFALCVANNARALLP